ncbi:SET domain-containing protein [Candidatus Woesearchaeota archaeon]|nr:SET domain-containing protein [Candidatus Woesearchaeota archaeon]
MSSLFQIQESYGTGRGLFATRLLKRGEQILEFTGPIISLEQALQKPADKLGFPLQIGSREYIDLEEPGVWVNHSCLPNAGISKDIFLVAIKDILPGEEIVYDYSTTMDDHTWTLECRCRSHNCRGLIRDFKDLPYDEQRKYLEQNIVQSFIREKWGDE